jgi:CheY-like chemotaxis protein
MGNQKFSFTTSLIIDDSEIDIIVNRRLMELTFFSENIIIIRTAEEALNFLFSECNSYEQAPDWIFLDLHLPLMNGYDFIEEFKKLPSFILEKTKIVILSVFQKQEQLQKVFENKFIFSQQEKPLTQQALKNLVSGAKETTIAFS